MSTIQSRHTITGQTQLQSQHTPGACGSVWHLAASLDTQAAANHGLHRTEQEKKTACVVVPFGGSRPTQRTGLPSSMGGGGDEITPTSRRRDTSKLIQHAPQIGADGEEVIPPFPWREMCIILLITSCDSIAFTQVFPYLGYFIIYLGMATDERTVMHCWQLRPSSLRFSPCTALLSP